MKPNKLRARMAELGYTQKKLAEKLNMSPNTMSHKMKCETEFSFVQVVKICRILNITEQSDVMEIFGE